MLAAETTVICSTTVGKLPTVEMLPATPAAAEAKSLNIAPTALEPTTELSFRTTGDSSPVIFGPNAGRAVVRYKPRQGCVIPTALAAIEAAEFTSGYRKRIKRIRFIFVTAYRFRVVIAQRWRCGNLAREGMSQPRRDCYAALTMAEEGPAQ